MAANAGAIRAGKAFVSLSLDDSALGRGLAAVSAKMRALGVGIASLGTRLFGLGALATGGLLGAGKAFADIGSNLKDASDRTGFLVEDLSALQFAAEQSGATFEDLETAIKFMQKGGFGSSAEDFLKIADSIQTIKDPMERTQEAIEKFGRGGTAMLPAIMDGFRKLSDEARRAGLVMSKADAEAADKFGDAMGKLWTALKMTVAIVGSALAPALIDLINAILPIISDFAIWIKQNQELVVVILKVAAGTAAIGAGLIALGVALPIVVASFAALWVVAKAGLAAVVAGFRAWMSPLNWVLSGIRYLTAAFLLLTETGAQVRANLMGMWTGIAAVFKTAWGGIVNAISAGELVLAFKVAVAGIKVVWFGLMLSIKGAWIDFVIDFRLGILEMVKNAIHGASAINQALGLKSAADALADFIEVERQWEQQKKNFGIDRKKGKAILDRKDFDAARVELERVAIEAKQKADAMKFKGGKALEVEMEKAGLGGKTGIGVGTFSAGGALAMGGGGGVGAKLDKAFKEQEAARKLLEKMLERMRGGGVVFG